MADRVNPDFIRKALLKGVGLLVGLGLLHGCALFLKAPQVQIVEVQIRSLGITSGTVEVVLDVTNDGRRQMDIRGFLYEVHVKDSGEDGAWASLAEGFFDQPLSVPGHETRRVRVPVPFEYSALGAAVRSLLSRGEIPYRLRGEVWLGGSSGGLQIPFRTEGVIQP